MNLRLSAAVGVVLGVVSLVALVVPAVTTFLPASDELVVVFGGLLVLGGVREVWRRRHFEPGYAETPDTEEPVELPTPGDEFDRQVGLLSTVLYSANVRTAVREEVIEIAVQTLQRRFDDTESEARTALREGTWTEDPFAAAFFTGRLSKGATLSWNRERFQSGTSFEHRMRRAIDELYRLAEEEDPDD